LFAFLFRNSVRASDLSNLPASNFIEMGRQIEIWQAHSLFEFLFRSHEPRSLQVLRESACCELNACTETPFLFFTRERFPAFDRSQRRPGETQTSAHEGSRREPISGALLSFGLDRSRAHSNASIYLVPTREKEWAAWRHGSDYAAACCANHKPKGFLPKKRN
jgi:hypothetical protein